MNFLLIICLIVKIWLLNVEVVNMKKIIIVLKPFVLNQSVYVYDNQKLINTYEINNFNISEKIIEIAKLYNIT